MPHQKWKPQQYSCLEIACCTLHSTLLGTRSDPWTFQTEREPHGSLDLLRLEFNRVYISLRAVQKRSTHLESESKTHQYSVNRTTFGVMRSLAKEKIAKQPVLTSRMCSRILLCMYPKWAVSLSLANILEFQTLRGRYRKRTRYDVEVCKTDGFCPSCCPALQICTEHKARFSSIVLDIA